MVMNPAANAGDERDMGSIPASGRSPGEWNNNPFWYSCLENSMQRTLVGYSQWSGKEMDMTNQLNRYTQEYIMTGFDW